MGNARVDVIAIGGLALLLAVPAAVMPPMTHDSFWIDWVWADQFAAELARGNPYPRWLPESHGGLGSPTFYFYPPLAFYVAGLFALLGLSTYASIIATFTAALAASGFAMHAWLKKTRGNPLLGGLLYMGAPYHLLDFYGRGALAESVAMAFIPLVALGIRRAGEGRFILGAIAYAGLVLSHMPLALLTSFFLVAPYGLYLSRGSFKRLGRLIIPLAIGAGLAAIYLIPALALEPYRDSAKLWAHPSQVATHWSVLSWGTPGPPVGMRKAIAVITVMLLIPAILLVRTRQRLLGAYAAACCLLAVGIIPQLWDLPILRSVQFPFRVLPLAEFAVATALARTGLRLPWTSSAALAVLSLVIALTPDWKAEFTIAQLAANHPDVPENLPPGEQPYSWPSDWAISIARENRRPSRIGDKTIEPVFFFPSWTISCRGKPASPFPENRLQLLAYEGAHCERRLTMTSAEKGGVAVSLAALLVIMALVCWNQRLRPKTNACAGGKID